MKITINADAQNVARIKRVLLREFASDYAHELIYLKQSKLIAFDADGVEIDDAGEHCVIVYTDSFTKSIDDIPF